MADDVGQAVVELGNDGQELRVRVVDDGVGLPEGFTLESTTGLGLQIVRTLVTTELSGTIEMTRADGVGDRPGTEVVVQVPYEKVLSEHREALADATRPPDGGR
jgi:two-component sensor histidine kinase